MSQTTTETASETPFSINLSPFISLMPMNGDKDSSENANEELKMTNFELILPLMTLCHPNFLHQNTAVLPSIQSSDSTMFSSAIDNVNPKPFCNNTKLEYTSTTSITEKNQYFHTNEVKIEGLRSGTHHKVVFSHILPLRGSAEQPPWLC